MQLAIIENNNIKEVGESSILFPNVSFPLDKIDTEFLVENSCVEVISWEMFNSSTEKQIPAEPYIKDGKVYTFITLPKTLEEIASDEQVNLNNLANSIRQQRNQFLKDSDWTQVSDAPVDKQAWAEYRQQLRDITLQPTFPSGIIFPETPSD